MLVVCAANLCRSPMAEGMLRQGLRARGLQRQFTVASAGTHVQSVGRRADQRALRVMAERGVDISRHRARPIKKVRIERFERILVVDRATMESLRKQLPGEFAARLGWLMDYAPGGGDVNLADPYFGPESGFRALYRQLEPVIAGVLDEWCRDAGPAG
ncbi:low molecular weight phosphotyrosine protein phosphatase [Parahaliea mediterranea]|uniref:protein-tyrosine-phosphatase n=1 Tax=Parahaliea mediterranea TaxID=651086 RepID=A0A939DG68_9GAMM|nr:low molecular weight protein-tyrosine-phosphatase [Parahaliea mediterranea]MBN7797473.1 low molecular weight phosphotyrosine protein phosphatase [Parahaliea mediterranea]